MDISHFPHIPLAKEPLPDVKGTEDYRGVHGYSVIIERLCHMTSNAKSRKRWRHCPQVIEEWQTTVEREHALHGTSEEKQKFASDPGNSGMAGREEKVPGIRPQDQYK